MISFSPRFSLQLVINCFIFLLPWQTRFFFATLSDSSGQASPFSEVSLYLTQVLLVAGLALAYYRFGRPKFSSSSQKIIALAALIIIWSAASIAWSSNYSVTIGHTFTLFCALLFFFALLDSRVSSVKAIGAFVLGLFAPSVLGIFQFLTGGSFSATILGLAERSALHPGDSVITFNGLRLLRTYGSFSHPNIFGGFLAAALIALWRIPTMFSHLKINRRFGAVDIRIILIVIYSLTLLLTFSRSAWLGLALGVIAALYVTWDKNTARARLLVIPLSGVIITAAITLSFLAPSFVSSLRGGGANEARSISERQTQYVEWWSIFSERSIVGTGLGNYVPALITSQQSVNPRASIWSAQPVHNVIALILAELGIIGAVLVLLWSSTIDRLNFSRFPNPDALTAFALGNLVLAILFFDHYLWSSWSGLTLIALVMALTVRMGEGKTSF